MTVIIDYWIIRFFNAHYITKKKNLVNESSKTFRRSYHIVQLDYKLNCESEIWKMLLF